MIKQIKRGKSIISLLILIFVYFPYIYALSTYYAIGGIYIPWYSSRIWEGGL